MTCINVALPRHQCEANHSKFKLGSSSPSREQASKLIQTPDIPRDIPIEIAITGRTLFLYNLLPVQGSNVSSIAQQLPMR